MQARGWLAAVIAVAVVVAVIFDIWIVGDAYDAILDAIAAVIGWIAGLGAGGLAAFALVLNAGITALSPILITVVGASIVVVAVAIGARVAQPVVETAKEHPFESISPVVSAVVGVATDLVAKASGIQTPVAEMLGLLSGVLVFGAGLFLRRPGIRSVAVGLILMLLVPLTILVRLVSERPLPELVDGLLSLPAATLGGLLLVTLATVGVAGMAWATRDD